MEDLVLDLITYYGDKVSTVEELITTAYCAILNSDENFNGLDRERETLKIRLCEMLAKNCSFRRKDFNSLMEKILADSETKRVAIQEEQNQVKKALGEYLAQQKELATYLKGELIGFVQGNSDRGHVKAIINEIKNMYRDRGEQIFALLRNLQLYIETFQKEQEKINHKLQRLVERGESLKIEDLRQLEAAKSREERKAERKLRREEVEGLLAHFKQERWERSFYRKNKKSKKGGE